MNTANTICAFIVMALTISATLPVIAQNNLEVEGKAKISVMDQNDTADSLVVRLSDGTLAVRDVSTLPVQSSNVGNYGTVVNPITGKVWLDRNLGATQVATSSSDAASYGDLYQWGRGADGHQDRTSGTTSNIASDWLAGINVLWNGLFITSPSDWLSTADIHMWSGTAAENNPCPSGFRLPTNAEWEQERLTWISNNAAGAFASPLKLPAAGSRIIGDGSLTNEGSVGAYWSSSASGTEARDILFIADDAFTNTNKRANGYSVRCIQN